MSWLIGKKKSQKQNQHVVTQTEKKSNDVKAAIHILTKQIKEFE